MKKTVLALLVSSALLISACEEKEKNAAPVAEKAAVMETTQSSPVAQASAEKTEGMLAVKIETLFAKGKDPNEPYDEKKYAGMTDAEREAAFEKEMDDKIAAFNPSEPLYMSVTVPTSGIAWLDNLFLVEAAKFFLPMEEGKPFPYTVDTPDLKNVLLAELKKDYQQSAESINESLAEMKQFEIEEGNATAENWQPPITQISQHYTLDSSFIGQKRNIATFLLVYENYTGGAHGWHNAQVRNVDLERQKMISVDDLVGAENQNALKDLLWASYLKYQVELAQRFAKESGEAAPSLAEIEQNLYLAKADLTIAESFQFTKEGVVFSYPPYAIGPYAEGQIELLVEWKDIQPLLSEAYHLLPDYGFESIPADQ
jgi:hypothetical protein